MKKLTIAALLLIISIFSIAQEKLTPEEMFRWFPEGKYEKAGFKDNVAAKTMPGFKKLNEYQFRSRWLGPLYIPQNMKSHWLTMVEMRSVKVVVSVSEEQPKSGRGGYISRVREEGKLYNTNSFGHNMQVIRFSPEIDLNKLAHAQKGVEKTEFSFGEMQVFAAEADKNYRWSESFFFCITPENEVLASTDIKLLGKMSKAGSGELPGVIDNFPFPALLELLPDLHQCWTLRESSASKKALIQKLEKDGVDNSIVERHRKLLLLTSVDIRDYQFLKDPVVRDITFYNDLDHAKGNFDSIRGFWGNREKNRVTMPEYGWYRQEMTKLSLKENIIYMTLIFDDDFIERYSELIEASKKESEPTKKNKTAK